MIRVAVPVLVEKKISFKVAQDDFVLELLNEGEFGATQVGKFITIYPESGECAREVAERLISVTDGFAGPEIVTDQHLGSIVYARYGGFNPRFRRDRLGNPIAMIEAADGSPIADRYAVPFAPPAGVANPFSNLNCEIAEASANGAAESSRKLVGPGYLIVEAIKPRPYGGTFLAIDLRAQETVALKILKHGRHHCMSDVEGREIRDRLRRQGVLHRQLSPRVAVPSADEYFEVDGHGYLPIEHLEGSNFEDFVNVRVAQRKWNQLGAVVQQELMGCLARIVEAVGQFHAAGYIHRDLSPGNILIGSDGRVHLLDLELAHRIGDTAPAYGLGTAGFMSRQQAARKSPAVADDVFALGCLMTFVLTGLDPRRTVFSSDRYRRRRLARLARGAPHRLIDLIAACLANDPKRRPDLAAVKEIVARYESPASGEPATEQTVAPPFSIGRREKSRAMDQVLKNGQAGLLKEFDERPGGLWLSARSPGESGRAAGIYQVECYANRGVAGIVYLLARLARCGHEQSPIRDCVQRAVAWLLNSEPDSEDRLPGLHFGEAGVAVAIAEAAAAGYVAMRRGHWGVRSNG